MGKLLLDIQPVCSLQRKYDLIDLIITWTHFLHGYGRTVQSQLLENTLILNEKPDQDDLQSIFLKRF